jgi:hypothetical protein
MVPLRVSFLSVREGENVGVERAVTRWYALRQLLSEEIVRLEATLAQPLEPLEPLEPLDANQEAQDAPAHEAVDRQSLQVELSNAQEKLRLLGSCPQPMMG